MNYAKRGLFLIHGFTLGKVVRLPCLTYLKLSELSETRELHRKLPMIMMQMMHVLTLLHTYVSSSLCYAMQGANALLSVS